MIALKIALTAAAVVVWLWTQRLLGARRAALPGKIGDRLHELTAGANARLNASPRAADALLISSSLIIDAIGLALLARAVLGDSIRPLLGLTILFSLRQVNQAITALPAPEGMIWRDPGFPSLFVTYGVSNDLFFSGHTALAFFGACELARGGHWPLVLLGTAVMAYEAAAVVVLRAHWTMDVFAGALAGLWAAGLSARLAPAIDAFLAGLF